MTIPELEQLLDLLQRKGVSKFSGMGVTMILGASAEAPAQEPKDALKEAARKLMSVPKQKRGRDGLTADEQEDVYGTPVDEFPDEAAQES